MPPGQKWTLEQNFNWLADSIANGDVFYIASSVSERNLVSDAGSDLLSVFGRELDSLLQAGYTRVGDYLVPPH